MMVPRTIADSWVEPSLHKPPRVPSAFPPSDVTRSIILPHAGFLYTKAVFEATLSHPLPPAMYDVVIMLCANHFEPAESYSFNKDVASVVHFGPNAIPLLAFSSRFLRQSNDVMKKEHSWQVTLMALHEMHSALHTLPHVILLVGQDFRNLASALLSFVRFQFVSPLWIISSDFTPLWT